MILVVIVMVLVVAIALVIFWLFKWEGELIRRGRSGEGPRASFQSGRSRHDDKVVYCDSEVWERWIMQPIAEMGDDDFMKL